MNTCVGGRWIFIAAAFVLAGCQAVPVTGRSQLNLLSDAEIAAMAHQSFSSFMATASKQNRVLSASESKQAAALITMVRRVSDRIIDAAGIRHQYNWETVVVKASNRNAFVTANGKIVVFTGIIPVAKSEAGVAAIIGHEVAHVVARHGAERVSQVLLADAVLTAADAAARNSKYRSSIGAALGLGAQYGLLLPFSREHESEADRIGLLYMAKAGYDPAEAVGLWERMEASGGKGPWEFVSTHPSPETRREQLRQWLPEANLYYADRSRPLPTNIAELQKASAERTAKVALAPIASQPLYEKGFWYRTRSGTQATPVTYRYDRNESCSVGDCLVLEGDSGSVTILSPDFALVEIRSANSWTRFDPALRMIRWPLRVGDSWSERVTIEQSAGKKASATMKAEVVGYESITVPSGSFLAYKIIISMNAIRFRELWYAPETQTFVRTITYDNSGRQTVGELIDYQRRDGSGLQ